MDKKNSGKTADREFGVILEKIHSEFKLFGEKLNAVSEKVDATFEEVGKQKEDTFIIKANIRTIMKDIAEMKETFKAHDKRIAHLETVK